MSLFQHFKKQPAEKSTEAPSATIKSFEEVYKTSYSHGLESIYALENVDIKSIRPISHSEVQIPKKMDIPEKKQEIHEEKIDQYEFDLGNFFRGWMESFVLTEPIQMLQLASQAEKILLAHKKNTITDLLKMKTYDYISIKGLGQGHIDQIKENLKNYLHGIQLNRCKKVNFEALLRGIIGGTDRKKSALYLESFGLSSLFPISNAEAVELRHLSKEKKEEWNKQVIEEYQNETSRHLIEKRIKKITDVFIIPWIKSRKGLATRDEIEERLVKISEQPELTGKILSFISNFYCEEEFVLKKFLFMVEQDLYCSHSYIAQSYRLVIQKTYSYFYHLEVVYPLKTLIELIEKDFAQEWISFDEGFIEKALRYTPIFRVRKNDGVLVIKLA